MYETEFCHLQQKTLYEMKTEVGRSLKCFYVSGKSLSISILIHSTHLCYMVVKPLCFVVMPFGKKPDSEDQS